MQCVEHQRIFHAHADQFGDGKKTPVIDAFVDVLPVRQFVMLFRQQRLQFVEARGIIFVPVNFGEAFRDHARDLFVFQQFAQTFVERRKSRPPFRGGARLTNSARGERFQRRHNSGVLLERGGIFSEECAQTFGGML